MTATMWPPRVDPAGVKARVHARLLAGGADDPAGSLPERLAGLVRDEGPLLDAAGVARLVDELRAEVAGLGPLEPLLADPDVTEVMVNGPDRVWVERRGRLERVPVAVDRRALDHLVEKVVAPLGLRADRASPLVDARLPDGSRVNVVLPPLALDGPCLTIRRFGVRAVALDEVCPPPVAELLAWAVGARLNVVVSGGTGAGKTTLLNTLAGLVPPGERVVTIEDAAELRLPGDHVVRLEARPPNAEGVGQVTVRDLVRNALRMRPDRIVVGECRGGEALDMLQAMNTGHEGSLSTCHANGPADALRRLETMALMADVALPLPAVREQVHSSVDLVVHVARGPGGARRVVEVAEVRPVAASGDRGRTRTLADAGGLRADPARPPRAAVVGGVAGAAGPLAAAAGAIEQAGPLAAGPAPVGPASAPGGGVTPASLAAAHVTTVEATRRPAAPGAAAPATTGVTPVKAAGPFAVADRLTAHGGDR